MHNPTLPEISLLGEDKFFLALQYLCLKKEFLIQDETILNSLTNFQVLMKVLEQTQDKDKKKAITALLQLLFPGYSVIITPKSILLSRGEQDVILDDNNFENFQKLIREVFCLNNTLQGENVSYNPVSARAKEIAAKLMRGRQRVAAQRQANTSSVLARYISILTIAKIISPSDLKNMTLFYLFDLMERYDKFIQWDIDLRVRLAGGSPEKQAESWMQDLYSKN